MEHTIFSPLPIFFFLGSSVALRERGAIGQGRISHTQPSLPSKKREKKVIPTNHHGHETVT